MLLLCLFWLTFPFYLNAQDDCSVFHEGACPLEVHLFLAPLIATRLVNTFAATLPHALSLTRVGVMKGTPHPLVFAGLWRVR